ncbi:MAG: biopolymer transporter ExbD [Chitinophagaceae bacterium]|nr:MAG: biopolymer transporter ExbD [Chitinophagaceae bacterium]
MAEITSAAAGTKPGGRRGKKLSTRVDLTPMVDLGFLLITFFIFTTTMSEPTAMKLMMPADGGEPSPWKESKSLTVIPLKNNRVFYYHGMLQEPMRPGSFGVAGYSYADGIGQVIRDKKGALDLKEPGSARQLMLIIKPMTSASYRNVVDILDEMTINEVKSYALTDLNQEEMKMLARQNLQ